jgi:hypothetical protein
MALIENPDAKVDWPPLFLCYLDFDTSKWDEFNLNGDITNALKYHKFGSPTPIQEKTLPLANEGRDIIGAAQTVSILLPVILWWSVHSLTTFLV